MTDSYTVDTNVIILLNRYQPRDVYEGPWSALEGLVAEGRACMPREAYEELLLVDDYCAPWAKDLPGFVADASQAELAVVRDITRMHAEWVQDRKNAADPFVVAHAVVRDRLVVTHERMARRNVSDKNLGIPNVAAEFGIECIDFADVARRERWQF